MTRNHDPRYPQPEPRRSRTERALTAVTAAGVAGLVALGIHSAVKSNHEAPQNVKPVGDLAEQHMTIDASKMLSKQLEKDPQALAIAQKMQDALDQEAKGTAGYVLDAYDKRDYLTDGRHAECEVETDADGSVTGFKYTEGTVGGNTFEADFGAQDGKPNLSNLTGVTVYFNDGTERTSAKWISRTDGGWSLTGQAADSGPGSDPALTFNLNTITQNAQTLPELTDTSYRLDDLTRGF